MWDPPAIKPWSFHSHQGIPIAGLWWKIRSRNG
jgi:hypothetical protein